MEESLRKMDALASRIRGSVVGEGGGAVRRVDSSPKKSSRSPSRSPDRKGRRRTSANVEAAKQGIVYADLQALYTDLLHKFRAEVNEKESLMADTKRNEEVTRRREARFREQISRLQTTMDGIEDAKQNESTSPSTDKLESIRSMHETLQQNVQLIQGKTAQILKDQERDLLRAFKTRMGDVNDELERERRKNESGSAEWVQRCHTLTEELEWMKDMTYRLEEQNKSLVKENKRLKSQASTQEEDREFLIKQILSVKKENFRLREIQTSISRNSGSALDASSSNRLEPLLRPRSAGTALKTKKPSRKISTTSNQLEKRYANTIRHLKRQIEQEQNGSRSLQTQLNQHLQQRSELQNFLKQCVDDVQDDMRAQRLSKTTEVCGFDREERQRVLELLFSQERVLKAFYDEAFVKRPKSAGWRRQLTHSRPATTTLNIPTAAAGTTTD